jgi:hypothetical protein
VQYGKKADDIDDNPRWETSISSIFSLTCTLIKPQRFIESETCELHAIKKTFNAEDSRMISAPPFLLASRCLLVTAHQQWIRSRCAADLFRRSASDCAEVLFEIFNAHCCELFALGWLRHRPAPFRVP